MKIFNFLKNQYFWLAIILLIGLSVRLYKIDTALADWHSWRQADTAAVARNFYVEGFNPLYPRADDMGVASVTGRANLERLRFVEFPIYNSLVYFAYVLNGGIDIKLARLVAIAFSLGSTVFIYLITKRYSNVMVALLASFLYAVLPFNVFFSRTILPEPSLVFFSLGMLYFVDKWIYEKRIYLFILAVIFTSSALLIKPTAAFYLLPVLYSYWIVERKIIPPLKYFIYLGLSFLPLVLWRLWIMQYPEGIPAFEWLMNGNNIRFKPAFFRWILHDRFGREILSVSGTILFAIGLLKKPEGRENFFLHIFAFSSLLYLVVFATGNVQHDYYQYFIVPALVIFVARGLAYLISGGKDLLPKIVSIPLALLLIYLTLGLTWYEVRGFYQINDNSIIIAGEAADKILPKSARVVAPYGGSTSFLYYINTPGFAYIPGPI